MNTKVLKFRFQMVGLCALSYVLDQPFKYPTSTQDKTASICSVFKWSGCLVFKWHSNTNHLALDLFSSICISNWFGIQIHCKLIIFTYQLLSCLKKTNRFKICKSILFRCNLADSFYVKLEFVHSNSKVAQCLKV